ncbi:MAG: Rv1535 family protein [Mycobacterium sp.]|uniref:Rv1535 family protein n=1 Tax=Mycobacterium sp. TaxID=1785 RepID=UPI003BB71988
MTAVLYDEVVVPMPAPRLKAVPVPAPTAVPTPKTSKRPDPRLMGDDPLVMGAARLLSIPLRQLYAALWRAGVLEVGA